MKKAATKRPFLWNNVKMKFRTQKKFTQYRRPVYISRFRPTREELGEICRKGAELLLNATPDEMKKFRRWA